MEMKLQYSPSTEQYRLFGLKSDGKEKVFLIADKETMRKVLYKVLRWKNEQGNVTQGNGKAYRRVGQTHTTTIGDWKLTAEWGQSDELMVRIVRRGWRTKMMPAGFDIKGILRKIR